ncbi:MAG: sensor histidine kinase [Sphingobacteriales bacterium]
MYSTRNNKVRYKGSNDSHHDFLENNLNEQIKKVDNVNQELHETEEKLRSKLAELESANEELRLYKQTMLEKDEFLNQGTWEYDVYTNKLTLSKGIYRLFGYHQKGDIISWDLLGKDLNSHLDSDELQKAKDDWVKIINEADTYLREVDITTKVGYKRRVETFGKVFRDDQGIAYKIIGTSRDITKLREYEQELEIKVEELNRSNKDLEEFAYIASHDLHEPLRKLSTFGQRLSTCAHDELSPLSSDYLQRMLKATDNMRNLIDNLLEFSRVTRGASTFVKTDLNKIFEEVVHEQELKIEETDAIIQLCDMPTLEVVPSQIKQLFNNLLNNALKFISSTNRPQVKFTCSLLIPEERNHFKLKYNREYFKITIEDNGIGFEKSYSEKIFQIFQRLHGKADYAGSGIGLAICRKIADNHKGLIFADSNPGIGSLFTVILPVKP